jgi:hypothetical protein
VIGQLEKYAEKNTPRIDMSIQGVFCSAYFLKKYARVQANDAQVQTINAVHPGVDAVNCTILSHVMCHTKA